MALRRPRFFLADLVAIIALAGLALTLMRSFGKSGTPVGIFVLIGLVAIAWHTFRVMREAPLCDKCGRRFILRIKNAVPPVCAQCGQLQLGPGRSRKALAIANYAIFTVVFLAAVFYRFLPSEFVGSPIAFIPWIAFRIALSLGMMLFLVLFLVLLVARFLKASAPQKPAPCENCRSIIPPSAATGPLICPRCRLGYAPRPQAQNERIKRGRIILATLLGVILLAGFILPNILNSHFGINYWIALPLVIVATIIGFVAVIFVVLVLLNVMRAGRLKDERYVLALARKAAGDDGEVVRCGPATVWYSGPTNPAPLLMEQMEATRGRLEALLGREIVSQPPRILCFRERRAFEAFLNPLFSLVLNWIKTLDGVYIRPPHRILAICTDEVPCRVLDTDMTARTLFCSDFFLEVSPGDVAAAWLQRGVSRILTSDPDARARLNRQMLVSLSRGTTLATDLFTLDSKEVMKMLKGYRDHDNFARYQQFSAESWSVSEYLGGEQAPEERRNRFRAFLNDNQSKEPPEDVFTRHFGFGFSPLVETWRKWVQEQGIGSFGPVQPFIQDGLLNRVIPLIDDRQAKPEDRIQAIRHMGIQGYILGADALIGLLQADDAIPSEEVVWALEAISGMAYGADRNRWTAWWNSLPGEVRDGRRQSEEEAAIFEGNERDR